MGTADTILLVCLILGSRITGLQIGTAEVVTKMILYYFDERVWFNFGLEQRKE